MDTFIINYNKNKNKFKDDSHINIANIQNVNYRLVKRNWSFKLIWQKKDMISELTGIFNGGIHSTALVFSACLFELILAKNNDIQEEIYNEIHNINSTNIKL